MSNPEPTAQPTQEPNKQKVTYDRTFLLQFRDRPESKIFPANANPIPGIFPNTETPSDRKRSNSL